MHLCAEPCDGVPARASAGSLCSPLHARHPSSPRCASPRARRPQDCPTPLHVKVEPYKGKYLFHDNNYGSRPEGPVYMYFVKCCEWLGGGVSVFGLLVRLRQTGPAAHAGRLQVNTRHAPPRTRLSSKTHSACPSDPRGGRHAAAGHGQPAAGAAAAQQPPLDDPQHPGPVGQEPGARRRTHALGQRPQARLAGGSAREAFCSCRVPTPCTPDPVHPHPRSTTRRTASPWCPWACWCAPGRRSIASPASGPRTGRRAARAISRKRAERTPRAGCRPTPRAPPASHT